MQGTNRKRGSGKRGHDESFRRQRASATEGRESKRSKKSRRSARKGRGTRKRARASGRHSQKQGAAKKQAQYDSRKGGVYFDEPVYSKSGKIKRYRKRMILPKEVFKLIILALWRDLASIGRASRVNRLWYELITSRKINEAASKFVKGSVLSKATERLFCEGRELLLAGKANQIETLTLEEYKDDGETEYRPVKMPKPIFFELSSMCDLVSEVKELQRGHLVCTSVIDSLLKEDEPVEPEDFFQLSEHMSIVCGALLNSEEGSPRSRACYVVAILKRFTEEVISADDEVLLNRDKEQIACANLLLPICNYLNSYYSSQQDGEDNLVISMVGAMECIKFLEPLAVMSNATPELRKLSECALTAMIFSAGWAQYRHNGCGGRGFAEEFIYVKNLLSLPHRDKNAPAVPLHEEHHAIDQIACVYTGEDYELSSETEDAGPKMLKECNTFLNCCVALCPDNIKDKVYEKSGENIALERAETVPISSGYILDADSSSG